MCSLKLKFLKHFSLKTLNLFELNSIILRIQKILFSYEPPGRCYNKEGLSGDGDTNRFGCSLALTLAARHEVFEFSTRLTSIEQISVLRTLCA